MERNTITVPAILVIDDDPWQRLFARTVLQAAGWRVADAAGGAEGVAAIQHDDFAVVLLDLQMPGMDGFATARAIRALPDGKASTPLLAYSTLDGPKTETAIGEAGMDGRVPKPTDPESLVAAVRPWLTDDGDATRERLSGLFGKAEFALLLRGLREQLVEVLDARECADLPHRAHRIAGLAGTLGFAEVSSSWHSISVGDHADMRRARLTARRAISAIDRRLG